MVGTKLFLGNGLGRPDIGWGPPPKQCAAKTNDPPPIDPKCLLGHFWGQKKCVKFPKNFNAERQSEKFWLWVVGPLWQVGEGPYPREGGGKVVLRMGSAMP